MHKQDDEKIAASVTIHDAADKTPEGRKKIAAWLRRHANDLIKDGDNYANRFRGRYVCAGAALRHERQRHTADGSPVTEDGGSGTVQIGLRPVPASQRRAVLAVGSNLT